MRRPSTDENAATAASPAHTSPRGAASGAGARDAGTDTGAAGTGQRPVCRVMRRACSLLCRLPYRCRVRLLLDMLRRMQQRHVLLLQLCALRAARMQGMEG